MWCVRGSGGLAAIILLLAACSPDTGAPGEGGAGTSASGGSGGNGGSGASGGSGGSGGAMSSGGSGGSTATGGSGGGSSGAGGKGGGSTGGSGGTGGSGTSGKGGADASGGTGGGQAGEENASGTGGTVMNPLTDPEDGPAAGYPDGDCPVPSEALPEDVSSPDRVVGDGTPESCTGSAVIDAVAAGGIITFNCGPDPVTITLDSPAKVFNDASDRIVIDGGGLTTSAPIPDRTWAVRACASSANTKVSRCTS
jgi:hypothetical protein